MLLATAGCTTVSTGSDSRDFHYEQVERSEVLAADYDEERVDVELQFSASYPVFRDSSEFRELNLHVRDAIEASESFFGRQIPGRRSEVVERRWAEVEIGCEVGLLSEVIVSVRCTQTLLGNLIPHQQGSETVFTLRKQGDGGVAQIRFQDLFPAEDVRTALVQLIVDEWCRTDASVVPGDRICDLDPETQASWADECVDSAFLGEKGMQFSNYRYPNGFEATIPYCTLRKVLAPELGDLLCPNPRGHGT